MSHGHTFKIKGGTMLNKLTTKNVVEEKLNLSELKNISASGYGECLPKMCRDECGLSPDVFADALSGVYVWY
jgi:hypothetical protein